VVSWIGCFCSNILQIKQVAHNSFVLKITTSVDQLIETLRAVVGSDAVLADRDELLVYECDGLPQHKHLPRAVVFPNSTEETAEVMRVLGRAGVAFTPRGAGTGLSGGAVALDQAVVVELARMRRILKIDEANRIAVVQTGIVNSHVSRAVAPLHLHYVPDPSSQPTCTIGGNIAENAGGVHCLKYGTTTDHVMGMRVVLAGGEIVDLGGPSGEQPGYDLRGLFIGSEGTFGIATEATLRLTYIPPTVRTLLADFAEVTDASHAVSAIIAAGLVPAGLEMMDHEIIKAVEASVFAAGLPTDAGAALLIELDGLAAGIDDDAERVKTICLQYGARSCRSARDENERKKLWAARKGAFGAIGRIAPDSMIQDAVVPRSRLPQIMADAYRIAAKYQLRIANVFHAGDGNLHPLICFDSRSADEVKRVKEAGRELMETCVRAGGSITGEHGVGLDKRELLPLVFSEDDMETMLRVRAAFDPSGLMNPGKIIPVLRGCGEARVLSQPGLSEPGAVATGSVTGLISTQQGATSETVATGSIGKGISTQQQDAMSEAVATGSVGELIPISKAVAGSVDRTAGSNGKATAFNQDLASRRLAAVVGAQNVTTSSVPFSASKVLTVSPASIDEACEIIKLASKERWTVLPAGAASWLNAGNTLRPINVMVSTGRLNHIIEHEPADLVAITQAGVSFRSFNEELMLKGQWLPLDPPGYLAATIGGLVATGVNGPQRYGYGPTRGFVIGLKIVRADGKLIKAGGRVVKNVAGYDLCKLFTGSYGTLGLIVEANFKLRPRPEREATVIASGPIASLIAAGQSILGAPLFPIAVELVSPEQARAIDVEPEDAEAVLLTRFAGNHTAVNEQSENALLLLAKAGISSACTLAEDEIIWQQLATRLVSKDNQISWRGSVPPFELLNLVRMMSESYSAVFSSSAWQAGIADGTIRMIQSFDSQLETHTQALQDLRRKCERLGGSLILEDAPLRVKEAFDSWGGLGKSQGLVHRIKQQLDPAGIFSPGRFAF
jgi:glycolate oxidase subunit GlcD